MTSSPAARVFRFASFEVNLRTGELRKHGIRLLLQEQPLRILTALLERPGEVITRDDLCRRLWPQGTFVDFEHSLNAAVRRLRVTLGDEAETPRFIETVHRRGYRFLVWGDSLSPGLKPSPTLSRLAVLPFVSFVGEDRHDLFSEGLTEETITQLARTSPPHIGVIARTGRVLGADYLLEGSIRREGDRVRINAQLIESQEDTHVWASAYDRVFGDALTLQMEVADQIARAVAQALSARQRPVSREAAS